MNDIESGELCLTIGHDWKHASIVCTHRQRMIYRLCIAPLTECKPNHHNAWEQNLPHEVCGPHVHGWPENRAYVMVNGFDQLPVRRAINGLVETIKDAVGWAATDLNILIAPDQRDFNYPVQELVKGPIMDCTELQSILDSKRFCERSENGAKILTQCLYPSADPVFVHVGMWGDGFRVTDGGGAAESALFHGKDENAVFAGLNAAGARHSLRVEGGQLVAFVPDKDWLPSAIMAVANGAALAASTAVAHITKKHERSCRLGKAAMRRG